MTDLSFATTEMATQRIDERISRASRARRLETPLPHGRHALARRLHQVADRLDG